MTERIRAKTTEIVLFLEELERLRPTSFEGYDLEKRAVCERYLEKIVEAITDLAFIIIKAKRLPVPGDDQQAFDALQHAGFISAKSCARLKDARGMRNIIAHQYGRIDDMLVYTAVTEELPADVGRFLTEIDKAFTEQTRKQP